MGEAADPIGSKVPYDALWRNPAKTIAAINADTGSMRGMMLPKTPGELLDEGMTPSTLQHALFFSNWTCNFIGSGPDPKIYGERSYANMLMADFGPKVIRVVEPIFTFRNGMLVAYGAGQLYNFFTTEALLVSGSEILPSGQVAYPLQEDVLGLREVHYYIDTETWHTYVNTMADGPAPIPAGYPYPDAYPAVMQGKNRAQHILSQIGQELFGLFDIVPVQAEKSPVPTGMAYYSPYFPVVLPEFAKIKAMIRDRETKLGLKLDQWNNGCTTKDLAGFVTDDMYPSPAAVALEVFINGLQLDPTLANRAMARWMHDWYKRNPTQKNDPQHSWFAETKAWPYMIANNQDVTDI